jgi:hypothetical protein
MNIPYRLPSMDEMLAIAARATGRDTYDLYRVCDLNNLFRAVQRPSAVGNDGDVFKTPHAKLGVLARELLVRPAFPDRSIAITGAAIAVTAEVNRQQWKLGSPVSNEAVGEELLHRLRGVARGSVSADALAIWLSGVLSEPPASGYRRHPRSPDQSPEIFIGRPFTGQPEVILKEVRLAVAAIRQALRAGPEILGVRWSAHGLDAVEAYEFRPVDLDVYTRDSDAMRTRAAGYIGVHVVPSDGVAIELCWASELGIPALYLVPLGTPASELAGALPFRDDVIRYYDDKRGTEADIERLVFEFLRDNAGRLDDWARREANLDLLALPEWCALRTAWDSAPAEEQAMVCMDSVTEVRRVEQLLKSVRHFRAETTTMRTALAAHLGIDLDRARPRRGFVPPVVVVARLGDEEERQLRGVADAYGWSESDVNAIRAFHIERHRTNVAARGGVTRVNWRRARLDWLEAGRPS